MSKAWLARDKDNHSSEEYNLFENEPFLREDGVWDDKDDPLWECIPPSARKVLDIPSLKNGTKQQVEITAVAL